jgi:hypothetical protein
MKLFLVVLLVLGQAWSLNVDCTNCEWLNHTDFYGNDYQKHGYARSSLAS